MPRRVHLALFVILLASSLFGCAGYTSYVESQETALGRVVVYRNGIAYFERMAHVDGDHLAMDVPRDKVDDFLKSLTVTDARTGKPFPVSFPTRAATNDGTVEMVIQLPSDGPHDLKLSYITEAPAWKPSYRLVVDAQDKVKVQGWAIVDNTSGEDWRNVRLGVGSSSALSFRYDLRTVRNVHRATLGTDQRFALAPPRGGSVHRVGETVRPQLIASMSDKDIPRPDDHPDVAGREEDVDVVQTATTGGRPGGGKWQRKTRGSGKAASPRRRYGNLKRVQQLAKQLNQQKGQVVLEGYAAAGERDGDRRSLDRANLLRNRLIAEGVAPARLQVKARGVVAGQAAGVRLVSGEAAAGGKPGGDAAGEPVGESHFESRNTMTVAKGTSAMVSILDGDTLGEVVYLYDAEAERGNDRFAFKAVRFKNPTGSTLESGPVTVYGKGRFIGEGLSQPIPPHQTAFVPFALDRQVVVETQGSTGDRIARLVSLQRGVLTAEVQHHRTRKLTVTNRSALPARVFVRHTVRAGWTLTKAPKSSEHFGESHLFELKMKAGETQVLTLEEATPLVRTVDLRTNGAMEMMALYLKTPGHDARLEAEMNALLALHRGMAGYRERIESIRDRMADYRIRVDELHGQIVNLRAVKAGGQRLLRHLKTKMMEISNRLQASTIQVVDLQEKLMLAKIEFQDGIAELSLAPKAERKRAPVSGRGAHRPDKAGR